MKMQKLRTIIAALAATAVLAGCTTNRSPGDVHFTTQATMELAVGTLNDSTGTLANFETGTTTAGTYLNAVTSFRNQIGNSAFTNPGLATLGGPGSLSLPVGKLFSYGQSPGANGVVGAPPAYTPAD